MEMRFEYINGVLIAHVQMFLDQVGVENFKYVLSERMKAGEPVVLDITRVYRVFEIFPTVEEAVASFQGAEA